MKNADMQAMPVMDEVPDNGLHYGLSKRERFCLAMGVPDTGDAELDAIIRSGLRQKHAAMAMQGLCADAAQVKLEGGESLGQSLARNSVGSADYLLAELERTGGSNG